MEKEGKKRLRMINSKIKPAFKTDEMLSEEEKQGLGEGGKGPLTGKYNDNLDMEFISFRGRDRRDQEHVLIGAKVPAYLASDIATLVQSGRTPFSDRSQFVRTAIIILMNYYGQKWPNLKFKNSVQHGLDICNFETFQKKQIASYISAFEKIIPELESKSDAEQDRFLNTQKKVLEEIFDTKVRNTLRKKFSAICEEEGINPVPYFGEEADNED